MDVRTHAEIGKFIMVASIFGIPAALLTGCGPGKVQFDATPPPQPPPKKECDVFAKPEVQHNIDDKSYSTFNYIWPANLPAAKLENWQPRARVYFGAAKELYQPTCEVPDKIVAGNVKAYVDASAAFFGKHYENEVKTPEESILVLIAGMAPVSVAENVVSGALDTLATATVVDPKIADEKKNFAVVLKAGYLFNKAAEKADEKTRFIAPRAGAKMTAQEKGEARAQLEKVIKMLKEEVKEEALNDRQKEFLRVLQGAAEGYKKSLEIRRCRGDACKPKDEEVPNPFVIKRNKMK